MKSKYVFHVLVVLTSAALAQGAPRNKTVATQNAPASATSQASQQHQSEGTQIFQQNCSRCHNAPEGFAPNISGTVIHHMRVRASLSKQDEEELLRFLNP
jgi:cytochrome c5